MVGIGNGARGGLDARDEFHVVAAKVSGEASDEQRMLKNKDNDKQQIIENMKFPKIKVHKSKSNFAHANITHIVSVLGHEKKSETIEKTHPAPPRITSRPRTHTCAGPHLRASSRRTAKYAVHIVSSAW